MNLKAVAAVGLLAVGVGAVGATVIGVGGGTDAPVTYRTQPATSTTVRQTAAASGSLAASTVYDLTFGEAPSAGTGTAASASATAGSSSSDTSTSGASSSSTGTTSAAVTVTWPVTAVNVSVGELVEAGDVLATADTSTAELAVRQAEANLAAARKQRRVDLAGGTATSRASAKDQVTSARSQLADAQASYSSTVAQNNLKLRQARRAVVDARDRLAADKRAGAPSATLDLDRASIRSARQTLLSTELQVQAANRSAASQVDSARRSLKSAQRSYGTATASADDATIVGDDVAVAEAERALAEATAALDMATLTAPIDGRITAVNVAVGDEANGTAIVLQSTRLAVSLAVTEDDIVNVAVGQAATVAIGATGTTASGTVTSIDPVATSSGSTGVVSYSVVVTLDGQVAGASATSTQGSAPASTATPLAGMSAEVTIVIAEAENAIAVPAIALSGTAGSYTVRVQTSEGSVETRSVQVGLVASDYAQITSGIAAGELVVTGSSADRTTTTTTTTTGRDGLGGGFGGLDGGGFQPPAGGFPGGTGGN